MQYYLFKQGTLKGPLTSDKIEELTKNKKIFEYQWMMESESQVWKTICESPNENPFHMSQQNMKGRTLSGAFFIAKNAYSGEIKQFHSFGIEMVLPLQKSLLRGLSDNKSIFLNLCDETNFTFVNAKAFIQSQEIAEDGLHIRFNWDHQEVSL